MAFDAMAYLAPHRVLKIVQQLKTSNPSYDIYSEDKTKIAKGVIKRKDQTKELQVNDLEGNLIFKVVYANFTNLQLRLVLPDGTELAKVSVKTITKVVLELVNPETKELILKGTGDWNKLSMKLTGPHGGEMSEITPAKGMGHTYYLKTLREGINPIYGLSTCLIMDINFHEILTQD